MSELQSCFAFLYGLHPEFAITPYFTVHKECEICQVLGELERGIAVVCRVMIEELSQSRGYLHSSHCGQHCTWSPVGIKNLKIMTWAKSIHGQSYPDDEQSLM